MTITTRFAPSPTGFLHLGSVRTALINYAFTRSRGGKFILRIEDTDQTRLVDGSIQYIKDTVRSLGMKVDLSYQQSDRKDIYQKYADDLIAGDLAYKKDNAIFVKASPDDSDLIFKDHIKGDINLKYPCKDFVIIKSDGFPTYHFACVVDDHLMGVTHVFRGSEWITSVPKHIYLYDLFGWDAPSIGHLSVIVKSDGKKLSKRDKDADLRTYRDNGYMYDAIANYCLLIGHGSLGSLNTEIFTLDSIIPKFDIKGYGGSNPQFDSGKFLNINFKHLRNIPDGFYPHIVSKMIGKDVKDGFGVFLIKNKHRIKCGNDIRDLYRYKDIPVTPDLTDEDQKIVLCVLDAFKESKDIKSSILSACDKYAVDKSDKVKIFRLVRSILVNEDNGPDLQQICDFIGFDVAVDRLTLV